MAKRKARIRKSSTRAKGRTRSARGKARQRKKRKPSVLAKALRAFTRALSSKRPDRVLRAADSYDDALSASLNRTKARDRRRALRAERKRVSQVRRGVSGHWTDEEKVATPLHVRELIGRVWRPIPAGVEGRYLTSDPSKRRDVVRVDPFAPVEELEAAFGDVREIRGIVIEADPATGDGGLDTWIEFDEPLDDWADLYTIERDAYEEGALVGAYA